MELNYAPPAKSRSRQFIVIAAGLFTSAVALVFVWYISVEGKTEIMSEYANYVIPWGALLVGLGASSGYGIASWITGVKIRKGMLLVIVGLSVLAYFGAQYVNFLSLGPMVVKATGKRLDFWYYFHLNAINFAWEQKDGKVGEPLGMAGYFFRMLELAGFVGGSLIAPAALMNKPYCELCEQYMSSKTLATIPDYATADFMEKRLKKANAGKQKFVHDQTLASADHVLNILRQYLTINDAAGFNDIIAQIAPGSKRANKVHTRVVINLRRCSRCNNGYFEPLFLIGQGKRLKTTKMAKTEIERELMLGIFPGLTPLAVVATPSPATLR